MYKVILAVVVIVISGGTGIILSNKFKARVELLRQCEIFVTQLQNYIAYRAMPTKEIFARLAKSEALQGLSFLQATAALLEENPNFPIAFARSLEDSAPFGLSDADKTMLLELCEIIGAYEAEAQCERLQILKGRVQESLAAAKEDYRVKGKLARTLSICCGLAAALLFV